MPRYLEANPLFLREEELLAGFARLQGAYHRCFALITPALKAQGLGPAHFRALHAIAQQPEASIGEIIAVLGISKQSFFRVYSLLQEKELVAEKIDSADRRVRRLRLTQKGQDVAAALWQELRHLLLAAYRQAGAESVLGFNKVLSGLTQENPKAI